jgi:hypothetical protein
MAGLPSFAPNRPDRFPSLSFPKISCSALRKFYLKMAISPSRRSKTFLATPCWWSLSTRNAARLPGVTHPPEARVISPIQSHERSSHLPELSEVPQQPTQPPKPIDLDWVYVKDSLKWETPLELRPASSTRPCHKLARAIHTTKKTRTGCRQAAQKVESLPGSKESKYSAISSRALSFYLLLMRRSCRAARAFAGSILPIRM